MDNIETYVFNCVLYTVYSTIAASLLSALLHLLTRAWHFKLINKRPAYVDGLTVTTDKLVITDLSCLPEVFIAQAADLTEALISAKVYNLKHGRNN